jgi:5-oxoprolinase (ATP-hydrolysing)
MTNSRLTDPEVLEARYPVRLLEHSVRKGSGGDGAFKGGDGSVRRIMFLDPMQAALLSGRRTEHPAGLNGGSPGATGAQALLRKDGTRQNLEALFRLDVEAGESVEILTPGGGGAGA